MTFVKKHSSQILVHILFWMLFVFVSLFLFSDFYWKENPFLQYLTLLVIIVYGNNFLLLPFFVKKKMYLLYTLVFAAISFLATQLYCYSFAKCGCTIIKCLSDYLWQSLVPLIFFSFIWILYRFIDKENEIEAIKKEHVEMELKFLKSQINPHVLFNNLNTIYSYSLEKPTEVPDMILMLSDNLKHVLYESNSKTISLEKEIRFIDNYMKFQMLRTEGTKQVNYKKSIDSYRYQIAPLLIITIIENAFKHSVLNSEISIFIGVENGILECICENDYDKEKGNTTDFRIGLQNLEKRLELIYKDAYEFRIDKGESFKVYLKLDFK
ncbi:histidine kinase [Flavivirga abyssicola]|uniref:sensor histidine kinase n=1 Tax=Flavivirga abyssicola TaxID=3063533 RepID=UPI0026DFFA03|nr:sensor histidine kinase [Flavivirga sp. MEBiC07777]WVK14440.1 histidine kinase [Flavivirga sp. MEBiC07777]